VISVLTIMQKKCAPRDLPPGTFYVEWDDACVLFDYVCLARMVDTSAQRVVLKVLID